MVAGHLQIKKDKYYMVLELKDEYGKRKTKWVSTGLPTKGNKRKAEAMLEEARINYQAKIVKDESKVLFSEYMQNWLVRVRPNLEESTYAAYQATVEKRIVPYFKKSGVQLNELKAIHIQDFYAYCQSKYHICNNTLIHYHANLMSALKYAVKMDLITENPMNKVVRPKLIQRTADFYSVKETEALITSMREDVLEFPVIMAAYYGLRRSEIVGLRWKAIDFNTDRITIDHTVIQTNVDGERKVIAKDRAKNKSSCRSLPLMPQIKKLLLRMKTEQERDREICGNCYYESGYVYVNKIGQPYKPDFITNHFKSHLIKNGFRKLRFHGLRHSCASMLLKNGVAMKDIQSWLGHSTYTTTANFYAHLDSTSKNMVGDTMENILIIPID